MWIFRWAGRNDLKSSLNTPYHASSQELFNHCQNELSKQTGTSLEDRKRDLHQASVHLNHKSSAGDKHETGKGYGTARP